MPTSVRQLSASAYKRASVAHQWPPTPVRARQGPPELISRCLSPPEPARGGRHLPDLASAYQNALAVAGDGQSPSGTAKAHVHVHVHVHWQV